MTEQTLILICLFIYIASWVSYLLHSAFQSRIAGLVGDLLTLVGLVLHASTIGLRWVESYKMGIGHAPFSNLYESMVFFSWTVGLIFLIAVRRLEKRVLGIFAMPLVFVTLAATGLMDQDVKPLMPALQSNWLTSHVVTCFLGYAAFAVAFCVSLLYLLKKGSWVSPDSWFDRTMPTAEVLDEFSYRIIAVGFPMLTLGIITGAAWANSAWGTYWSWDPKETWSLIVWLIYAAYLHARITRGWKGKRSAWLSIAGFAATLFCYLGVNLLLSGLHSYATG